jgi:hypothetical protein
MSPPEAKALLTESQDTSSSDSLAQLFLPKKFAFKPTGAPSVGNVIKKIGLYNNDEEEEDEPKAAVSLKAPV